MGLELSLDKALFLQCFRGRGGGLVHPDSKQGNKLPKDEDIECVGYTFGRKDSSLNC